MQIIGLSATIGNPKMLAGWLDAELVTSDLAAGGSAPGRLFQ